MSWTGAPGAAEGQGRQRFAAGTLARTTDRLQGRTPEEARLRALWQAAQGGAGEVLRASRARTVLRVRGGERGDWVLKIYHPERRRDAVRGWLRGLAPPPARREAALFAALRPALPGLAQPVLEEQLAPGVGLLARPWIEGASALEALSAGDLAAATQAGHGLALLHSAGWSDPDLHPRDLVLSPGPCPLLPLDLGHARCTPAGAPPLAARADVLLFLAGLPPEAADAVAARLLAAYAEASRTRPRPPWLDWRAGTWRVLVRALRRRVLWRQSARCRRDNPDFERVAGGARRRGVAPPPPVAEKVLSSGRRTRVLRRGDQVTKLYLRAGWRRLAPADPAGRAWRRLYCLELHGIPAARARAWSRDASACALTTELIAGRPALSSDAPALARWLARLHAAGLGLRDAKPRNFCMGTDGGAVLVDADGVRCASAPARDLGRLLAEAPADSALEEAIWSAYDPLAAPALRRSAARHAARFRALLARARRDSSRASAPASP
ncbi:MAG: hypothetical protein EYC70_05815 [Planctomycetota bacterium]|nr:MAG: hypothetical protein EYC70_05815 [Planctomycetota bacterium]